MRTKKMRLMSFVLALAMMLAIAPVSAFAEESNTQTYHWAIVKDAENQKTLVLSYDSYTLKDGESIDDNKSGTFSEDMQANSVSQIPWNLKANEVNSVRVIAGQNGEKLKPTSVAYWFRSTEWDSNIKQSVGVSKDTLKKIDLTGLDTSNATSMAYLFSGCESLEEIVGLENLVTDNVTDMSCVFNACKKLSNIDVTHFNTSKVTSMWQMFAHIGAGNATPFDSIDLSNFNTSNVTDMHGMFLNANVVNIDLSNFDTSSVTDMHEMFRECRKAKKIDVHAFNTSNVTDMSNMFCHADSLEYLDLSNFDTTSLTNAYGIALGCKKLKAVDFSTFDFAKLEAGKKLNLFLGSDEVPELKNVYVQTAADTNDLDGNSPNIRYFAVNGGKVDLTKKGFDSVTKTGYKATWYEGENQTTDSEPSAGKTYIAHWIPKEKYTVTFDLNGHGDTTTQTVYEDDPVTKPKDPTAKGYKFAGWYTDAECKNAFDFTKPITGNTTVYAKWEEIPDHQLTVVGGTFTVKDETVETKTEGNKLIADVPEGAEVTVTFNKDFYADSNLVFGGWMINGLDNAENYTNKEEFTFIMPENGDGVTIEAQTKTADTEDDSWDAATIVAGVAVGAGAAVLTYHIGTELYAEQVLGKGVSVPKTREEVALKAWELAGKPAVELNGEPLSEAAQAEKWAVESGLMQNDAEGSFNGAKKMNKLKALRTLDSAKKMNAQ